jgi:hypothetical protein
MKIKFPAAGIALLLACGALSFAQAPDFSGTWKLNAGKSDFGDTSLANQMPGASPSDETLVIRREGGILVLDTRRGVRRVTTDGKESLYAGAYYKDLKITARFEAGKLVVNLEEEFTVTRVMTADDPGTLEYVRSSAQSSYELSADGKTLTVIETATTPGGDSRTMKKVFDRTGP